MAFAGMNPHLGALPPGAPLVTLTGATPSIAQGTNFRAVNSGATTITQFLDASEGQLFTVLLDANTTIDCSSNANITGHGGVDVAGAAGRVVNCRVINGVVRILSVGSAA
jgi:hypothetical protein